MDELLRALSISGDVGIWVLIGITWKFHDRLLRLELNQEGHCEMDEAEFKRINARLQRIEGQ